MLRTYNCAYQGVMEDFAYVKKRRNTNTAGTYSPLMDTKH